jgi:predicted Zn-dependent protease
MRRDFGVLLFSRGELDEATRQFLELKKLLPHHPGPCVLLARVYAQQGERYQAIAQCDEALRLRPGWPQAIQLRAEVQAALEQPH